MKNKHKAIYGDVVLIREWCKACKQYALVVDSKLQCCDKKITIGMISRSRLMVTPKRIRRIPSGTEQREILLRQANRCLYCDLQFGTPLWSEKRNKVVFVKIAWDHFVPYSYSFNNKRANFVGACSICNGIKSNKMFETLKDARNYILYTRKKKGYKTLEEVEGEPV